MKPLTALALLAALGAPAWGKPDAKALAPFLDGRTFAVVHADLAATDALGARLAALAKLGAGRFAGERKELEDLVKGMKKAGAADVFLVASLADVPTEPPFVVVPLPKGADAGALVKLLNGVKSPVGDLRFEKVGGAVVGGGDATRKRLKGLKPSARPDVAAALGAGAAPLRLVLVPTRDLGRILEETLPTLPDELGGGSVKPLARGLRWLALGFDPAPKRTATVTAQAADAASAKALADLAARAAKALAANKEVRAALPGVEKLLTKLKPAVAGDRVTWAVEDKELTVVLGPLLEHTLEELREARATENLRRVLQALLAYEAEHRTFPPFASHDKAGKPLLSWRVHLLPHLGEGALYKEFKLDEPWDSPHNKKLVARMPAVYRPADAKLAAEHRTTLLAPLEAATMFPGERGVRVAEVLDGAANTVFLVDAADERAVVWTKPDDLTYDPKAPRKGLAARHRGRVLTGFVDGAVRLLPADLDAKTLAGLFTRAGGEAVAPP